MTANVKITSAAIAPNPAETSEQITISVKVEKRIFGLSTAAGKILVRVDGRPIVTTKG